MIKLDTKTRSAISKNKETGTGSQLKKGKGSNTVSSWTSSVSQKRANSLFTSSSVCTCLKLDTTAEELVSVALKGPMSAQPNIVFQAHGEFAAPAQKSGSKTCDTTSLPSSRSILPG